MNQYTIFQHDVDKLAINLFRCLVKDFRTLLGQQDFAHKQLCALNSSVRDFREVEWPRLGCISVTRFKAWWQLRHLFKRHRFGTDMYTDDDLIERTLNGYRDFNLQRSTYTQFKYSTLLVLREARKVNREILGEFDPTEDLFAVKIGRRATLGGSRRQAYLDDKLSRPSSFTCPSALRDWLFHYLADDSLLKSIARKVFKTANQLGKPVNLCADYLNLVLVDKSWKIMRSISPLSLIGLFYSFWVGYIVEKRLKSIGLNIRTRQAVQRKLAQRASRNMRHVTADLSSASDSLRSDILNRVLPRQWYVAIKRTFIRQVVTTNGSLYTEAVLPMGNGATFPVETLVFYSLIRAIGRLMKVKGTYSVYGDDLIYPTRIHPIVCQVFGDLGLKINSDKTFVDSNFRESCGGDFYHGFDVRPAMLPPAPGTVLTKMEYAAYLYKVLNALLKRWDPCEIPLTIRELELELLTVQKEILQVPPSFPATAGRHTDVPLLGSWIVPYAQPKSFFKNGSCYIAVRLLSTYTKSFRPVITETPYYWDKLRSMASRKPDWRASFGWFKRLNAPMPTVDDAPQLLSVRRIRGKRVIVVPEYSETPPYRVQIDQVLNWS